MVFEVPEETRKSFIEKNILGKLPREQREAIRERIETIVNNYQGQDINAVSVLAYAAERGRLDEFAGKLEKHYNDGLAFVHPEARRIRGIAGAHRAEEFFLECYKALGIQPRESPV